MGEAGDRVLELLRKRAQLDAEIAEASVEFEASGAWRAGGANGRPACRFHNLLRNQTWQPVRPRGRRRRR